ncbi:MAG TPA: 3-ketoacyl-ACP reductase, partial [Dehalococcoidia bacterium]|nr:3-ketoacyl-ACP reductase [Dehalococcoidia bacterium]
MNSLENQVAIVTGGAMGIGGATSRSLADSGAKVLIADIAIESAETNARAIRERGGTVLVVEADVSKALSIKNMIDHAIEEWGRLDILVNNAYNAPFGGNQNVVDTTEEQWDAGMALLVKAIFLGAKYAVPHM